jgi:hypothetical protein
MNNPEQAAIGLREKLGCQIVQLSKETRAISNGLSRDSIVYLADRGRIFTAIEQSGWWFDLAEEGAGKGRYDPLEVERNQQAILKSAGITDDATAIAWMDSVRRQIESDRAEYEAILERHRSEISGFLESKRGKA